MVGKGGKRNVALIVVLSVLGLMLFSCCIMPLFIGVVGAIVTPAPTPEQMAANRERAKKERAEREEQEAQRQKEKEEREAAAQKARYDAKMKYWQKLAGEWDEHEAKWEKDAAELQKKLAGPEKLLHAWVNAAVFVKERLERPDTASFGTVSDQDPLDTVTPLSADTYRAQGWVDSQDSTGTTVRADFVVTVKDLGDKWQLVGEPEIVQR